MGYLLCVQAQGKNSENEGKVKKKGRPRIIWQYNVSICSVEEKDDIVLKEMGFKRGYTDFYTFIEPTSKPPTMRQLRALAEQLKSKGIIIDPDQIKTMRA